MTEESTDLPGSIVMRCSRCHSTDVRRDGIACWNPSRQQWELIDVLDDGWCEECGAEGRRVIEEHAATGQQLPGTPSLESVVGAMERASALQVADMMAEPTPEGIERAKAILAAEATAHADPNTPTEASDQGGADESE